MTLSVTIDTREQNRIQSATRYYESQGLDVTVEELPIGDYIFTNETDSVVFEFKLVADFVSSIQSNRIFNQAISQTEEFNHHYVIIHGDQHSRAKALAMTRHYQPISLYQYLGAIASLNKYTTVIETSSPFIEESYYRMMVQAKKCLSTKPIVRKFPRKNKNPSFNYLCYCIYGINQHKAQLIVDTYELESLHDLFTLSKKQLLLIEGIGEKTATNIIEAIHGSTN